jgi:RimJ/RimL family protein N-acetyltransferase
MMHSIFNDASITPEISIRPWNDEDLPLLRSMNTEQMWDHLGGPETEAKVLDRHQRYLESAPGKTRMFVIMFGVDAVGSVGYWYRHWDNRDVYEVGWMVLPEFQGRGIATRAISMLLNILRTEVPQAVVHAFPSNDNPASNSICTKLGFSLVGETDFEFPLGKWMKCNDWCLEF